MSKQIITGIREYNFKDETSGRQVEGMSVYYKEVLQSKDGVLVAKGYTTGKIAVTKGTELYQRLLNANYDKPFEAEVVFDIVPGSKRPILSNIIF